MTCEALNHDERFPALRFNEADAPKFAAIFQDLRAETPQRDLYEDIAEAIAEIEDDKQLAIAKAADDHDAYVGIVLDALLRNFERYGLEKMLTAAETMAASYNVEIDLGDFSLDELLEFFDFTVRERLLRPEQQMAKPIRSAYEEVLSNRADELASEWDAIEHAIGEIADDEDEPDEFIDLGHCALVSYKFINDHDGKEEWVHIENPLSRYVNDLGEYVVTSRHAHITLDPNFVLESFN